MKSRIQKSIRAAYPGCSPAKWTWIIAICLLTALTMPTGLAAQSAPGYNYKVLYTFSGTSVPSSSPSYGDLIQDEQGNLYGTTAYGGDPTCMCGYAFELDPAGNFTVLHTFTGAPDGAVPFAGLTRDSDGNLYGTTGGGGANGGYGTVFKIDAKGHESILYSFGGADGNSPYGSLFRDADGSLYGTTLAGGNLNDCSGGCGVVFKLDPSDKFSQLYLFKGAPDGWDPGAPLVRDAKGNFYSTTSVGGTSGQGTVYELSPNSDGTWTESVLYSFTGGADGGHPLSGVILDPNGNLYGTAASGGPYCGYCGVVFKIDSTGHESTFYAFTGGTDGAYLEGGLVRDLQGNLYGTAATYGNQTYYGTVYKLDPTARETTLYSFSGLSDGGYPTTTLVRDHNGNLFGNNENGGDLSCGAYGCGVIFEISACRTANCRTAR